MLYFYSSSLVVNSFLFIVYFVNHPAWMDDDVVVVDDDRDATLEVQTNFCFITNLLRRHDDHKLQILLVA